MIRHHSRGEMNEQHWLRWDDPSATASRVVQRVLKLCSSNFKGASMC
jgi:hypothetical protein